MLTPQAKADLIAAIDDESYRGLTDRQLTALHKALAGQDPTEAARVIDQHLLGGRVNVPAIVADLNRARATRTADQAGDMPEHSPHCDHGCEGEAWLPGPTDQLTRLAAGEPYIGLARCPGPDLTPDVWAAMCTLDNRYRPASDRALSASATAALANARALLPESV